MFKNVNYVTDLEGNSETKDLEWTRVTDLDRNVEINNLGYASLYTG
jgi:hypothetical protein